jgi:uncharacterized protein (TIGR01777 family)
MNVLVTGEFTYIGKRLITKLVQKNHHVIVLTPQIDKARKYYKDVVSVIHWESYLVPPFLNGLEIDSVIHLAGDSLQPKRWTNNYRKEIYNSRVDSTRALLKALQGLGQAPKSFITSCIDIEKHQFGLADGVFLEKVFTDWRKVLKENELSGTRMVTVKPSLILSKESRHVKSIIKLITGPMGTHWGSGGQKVSWIHVDDLANMYIAVMEDVSFTGDLKASSPYNVTNREFLETLTTTMGRKTFIPVPKFYLQWKMGFMTPLLLEDNQVEPKDFTERRFLYLYPTLEMAIKEVLSKNAPA